MHNSQLKVTRKIQAVHENMVEDTCSDTSCGITIMVDKHDKEQGRKFRCTACLMRDKLSDLAVLKR